MPACRLLPYAVADGPHHMAADETLLESAAAGVASLRFYGWEPATASLGYFQPERVRHDDPHLAGLPYVRRPSGGGTLVHHHEVTYCLALPSGPPWQPGDSWLCRMHGVIASALAGFGVTASSCGPRAQEAGEPVLCFQRFTPGDLLVGGGKVVGSAQRRQRGALMQHGGILLAASPYTPVLPGIRELSGQVVTADEVCASVAREFARQTAWQLVPGAWPEAERSRVEGLAAEKYARDEWNRKR